VRDGGVAVQVLDTPSGRLVQSLYAQGCRLGVSSRGWASLRDLPGKCYKCIMSNFELITFDFVTEPSTKGAWLLPYFAPYSARVPPQPAAAALSRLGVGAVPLEQWPHLPRASDLRAGFAEFQRRLQARPPFARQAEGSLAELLSQALGVCFRQGNDLTRNGKEACASHLLAHAATMAI
jgi:hypothetical protein